MPAEPLTVFASIKNDGDLLSQPRWHAMQLKVRQRIMNYAGPVHGEWFTAPISPYQGMCLSFEVTGTAAETLKAELRKAAADFGVSVKWSEALTEFLSPSA